MDLFSRPSGDDRSCFPVDGDGETASVKQLVPFAYGRIIKNPGVVLQKMGDPGQFFIQILTGFLQVAKNGFSKLNALLPPFDRARFEGDEAWIKGEAELQSIPVYVVCFPFKKRDFPVRNGVFGVCFRLCVVGGILRLCTTCKGKDGDQDQENAENFFHRESSFFAIFAGTEADARNAF